MSVKYRRYFKKDCIDKFSETDYLQCLREYTELAVCDTNATPEHLNDGYIPFYVVTYVRSTGNDVIVLESEGTLSFYSVMKSLVTDSATTIEDEGLLSAKKYLETVATESALSDMSFPFKSFPSARGASILKVPIADGTETACFMIMSVIVEQDYFDKLELNEGYRKVKFNRSDYSDNVLVNRVADSFIKVHKPTGGTT